MLIAKQRLQILATPLLLSTLSTASIYRPFSSMSESNNVELSSHNEQIIKDSQALFGAKPTSNIFRNWNSNATFEDPICYAVGSRWV